MVKRSHIRALLVVLVALFFVIPLISAERGAGGGAIVVQITLAVALAGGIYAVGANKLMRRLIFVSLFPAVVLGTLVELNWIAEWPWAVGVWAAYVVGFSLVGAAMTYHLIRERRVTLDTIASALATYLLFGLVWALIYVAFEHFDPDAFSGLARELETGLGAPGEKSQLKAMLYYSFTTLTTLGYGDIVPVNPLARSLSVLEAAFGQIYLAILVARLVGIHTARAMSEE